MWTSPQTTVGPGDRNLSRRSGNMAQRKRFLSAQVGLALGVGVMLAVLMTGRLLLLNQVTTMRASIAVLQDRKGFLETRSASLQERWNQATSLAVVRARAEKELGLMRPDDPGLVLVKLPQEQPKGRSRWPGWLGSWTAGDQAQAGELAPITVEGAMVHLAPRSTVPPGEGRGR